MFYNLFKKKIHRKKILKCSKIVLVILELDKIRIKIKIYLKRNIMIKSNHKCVYSLVTNL